MTRPPFAGPVTTERWQPPTTCWCGRAVQAAPDHTCRQCAEHCEIAAYREGRPSPRGAP